MQKFSVHKVMKNVGIYFATSIVNRAIPFLLLPLLTHYLTPVEYGLIALYQVCITFVMPVIGMNMQANITRNFFRVSQEEVTEIVTNLFVVLLFNTSLVIVSFAIFAQPISQWLEIDALWLYAIPLVVVGNMVYLFDLNILKNQRRPWPYGLMEIGRTVLNVGVTLFLIIDWQWGWVGRAGGIVVSSVLFGIIAVVHLWQMGYLSTAVSRSRIREIFIISIPLISHTLSTAIIDLSDRFFIDQMMGKEALGIYNVGYQFGWIVGVVANSFNLVWSPWMYEQLANLTSALRLRIVRLTYLYALGTIVLAFVVAGLSYFVIPIAIPSAYSGAVTFVLWVALGYSLRAMYTMVFPYLVHEGKTSMLGVITLGTAIINLVGNYVFIQWNGTVGAAQSTFLSYLCQFVFVWWYAHSIHPMPWRLKLQL